MLTNKNIVLQNATSRTVILSLDNSHTCHCGLFDYREGLEQSKGGCVMKQN